MGFMRARHKTRPILLPPKKKNPFVFAFLAKEKKDDLFWHHPHTRFVPWHFLPLNAPSPLSLFSPVEWKERIIAPFFSLHDQICVSQKKGERRRKRDRSKRRKMPFRPSSHFLWASKADAADYWIPSFGGRKRGCDASHVLTFSLLFRLVFEGDISLTHSTAVFSVIVGRWRCTFTRVQISTFNLFFFQAQKRELDHIRQNYRKNSLARSSPGGSPTAPGSKGALADPPFVFLSSETGGGPGGGGMGGSDEEEEEKWINRCWASFEEIAFRQ